MVVDKHDREDVGVVRRGEAECLDVVWEDKENSQLDYKVTKYDNELEFYELVYSFLHVNDLPYLML